jgi:uncharacterized lipoprotein YddW (UPF0748 family)
MGRLLFLAVLACVAGSAFAGSSKLRGMWVDVFHDGIKTPAQVNLLIQRAKRANINALFVQVRSRGQVYHMSAIEHRAPDTMPLFDGLREVVMQAHNQDPPIQVHAWINAFPVWEKGSMPPWPDHVVYTHPEWLTKNPKGSTDTEVGKALDFGNPEAVEYLKSIYLEVAHNYSVDGIHLDFIRYSGAEWGYNDVSVRRFFNSLTPAQKKAVLARSIGAPKSSGSGDDEGIFPGAENDSNYAIQGLPATGDPLFSNWRRAQVTGAVDAIVKGIKAIRPDIVVSAATVPWGNAPTDFKTCPAYVRCFQDWKSWAQKGSLDMVVPMLYFKETDHAAYFRNWVDYCANLNAKSPIAAGIGNWLNSPAQSVTQAKIADKKLDGYCFFSYASTNPMPGKEAQLFNETFYDAIGKLPKAAPPKAIITAEP